MRILPLLLAILCFSFLGCDQTSFVTTEPHRTTEMRLFSSKVSFEIYLQEPRDSVSMREELVLIGTDDQPFWPSLHPEIRAVNLELSPSVEITKSLYNSAFYNEHAYHIDKDSTANDLLEKKVLQRYTVIGSVDVPMVENGKRRSIVWNFIPKRNRALMIDLDFRYYPKKELEGRDFIAEAKVECKLVRTSSEETPAQESENGVPHEVPCQQESNTKMIAAPTLGRFWEFKSIDELNEHRKIEEDWENGEWSLHLSFETLTFDDY